MNSVEMIVIGLAVESMWVEYLQIEFTELEKDMADSEIRLLC